MNEPSANQPTAMCRTKSVLSETLKIVLPILLGGAILYWMYRDFDFGRVSTTLARDTNWWIMSLSLVFGVTAQVFRGLRWKQTLAPLGEYPRTMNCVHAIFLSYASSLIIPRSGEVTRCGVLTKYDGTSFSKSFGTVVSERIVDSVVIMVLAVLVFMFQMPTFMNFFSQTGIDLTEWVASFSTTGYIVTAVCGVVTVLFLWYIIRHYSPFSRLRQVADDIKAGIFSLRHVSNMTLYVAYTIGIWGSYFLHFYITFFCFPFTSSLTAATALVAFVVGSFAVIVPTPNGMGSWHFAVKTVLLMAGVESATDAETYVLIVHAIQTALMPLLAIYSTISLLRVKSIKHRPMEAES